MKRFLSFLVFIGIFFVLFSFSTNNVYADNCCGGGYKCSTACREKLPGEWMCTLSGGCVPESGIDISGGNPTVTYTGGTPVTPAPAPAPGTTPAPDPCSGTALTCAQITCNGSETKNLPGCPPGGCPATMCCERTSCSNGAWCQVPGWGCATGDACIESGGHWHHVCNGWDYVGNFVQYDEGDGRAVDGAACSTVPVGGYYRNDCNYPGDTTAPFCNNLQILGGTLISPTRTSSSPEYTDHPQCANGDYSCNYESYCSWCGDFECGNCNAGGDNHGILKPNCVKSPFAQGSKSFTYQTNSGYLKIEGSSSGETYSCSVPDGYFSCTNDDKCNKCRDCPDGGCREALASDCCTRIPWTCIANTGTNNSETPVTAKYSYYFDTAVKPDIISFDYNHSGDWYVEKDGVTVLSKNGSGSGKVGGLDVSGASTISFKKTNLGLMEISNLKFARLNRKADGTVSDQCPTGNPVILKAGVGDISTVSKMILANPTTSKSDRFSTVTWGRDTNTVNSCTISDTAWADYTPSYLWDWCPTTREVGLRFEDGKGNQNATVECAAMCVCESCPEVISALPPGDSCVAASSLEDGWSIDPVNQTAVFRADYYSNQTPAVGEETAINLAQFNLGTVGSLTTAWPLRTFYATNWKAGQPIHSFFAIDKATNTYLPNGGVVNTATGTENGLTKRYLKTDIVTSTYTILGDTSGLKTRIIYNNANWITVFFVVKFKSTFPAATYAEYLYVRNLDGQEDQSLHTGLTGWVAKYTEGTFNFHQFGNFKERQCTGNLQVNVYAVTSDAGACAATATAYTAGGTYEIKDTSLVTRASGNIPAIGAFPVNNLTVGNFTSSLMPVPGWRVAECTGPGGAITKAVTLAQPITIVQDQTKVLNYYLINKTDSWFQVKGGDVHAETSIRSYIPSSFLPANRYFNLDLDTYPGLITYGTDYDFWVSGFDPIFNTNGPEYSSSKKWLAQSPFAPGKTNYQRFYQKLGSPTVDNFDGTINFSGLKDGINLFYSADKAIIEGANSWTIPANKKVVILINGDLDLSLNQAKQIIVDKGGFIAFIVNGNINITQTMGSKKVANIGKPVLQGMYYAENKINTQTDINDNNGEGPGKMIVGEGLFYGKKGFVLERTLKDDCSDPANVCNLYYPSEYFIFRPDLVINAPYELWFSDIDWQEVVP